MKMKIKKIQIIITVALIIIAGIFFLPEIFSEKLEETSYKAFYQQVATSFVEKATIKKDCIIYKTQNNQLYKTENPHSPTLEEYLLLNDVEIEKETDGADIFTMLMDSLFYIFFFGMIIFVFRKFISPNTFKVTRKTGVNFKNIVGMDNLKNDMKQVVDIMLHPKAYKAKGIRMPKGIILEGEPGNGKTLFARALAEEAKVNFIAAKATDFESMFMAIGPMKVKLLFRKARKAAPCIVFIDEFDGIGTRRNYTGSAIETENTRIVTALLNELDGFEQNEGILVIAATNSIHALDKALIRPGRFDAHFTIPYPDEESRKQLIDMYSNGKEREPSCSSEKLSSIFKGFSCAKIESVINRAALIAAQNNRTAFNLSDVQAACLEQHD
ncbi:MAG: AAA family ATPase [Treponema sp.]|nr:AAA family ATPase [Treponema sp.]